MKMNKGCTVGCFIIILIMFIIIFVTYFFYRSHKVESYIFEAAIMEDNMIDGIKITPSISDEFKGKTVVYVPDIFFFGELKESGEISITLNKIKICSDDEEIPLMWESVVNEDISLDEGIFGFYEGDIENPISFNKSHLEDGKTYSMFVDVTVNSKSENTTKTVFCRLICKKEIGYALPT